MDHKQSLTDLLNEIDSSIIDPGDLNSQASLIEFAISGTYSEYDLEGDSGKSFVLDVTIPDGLDLRLEWRDHSGVLHKETLLQSQVIDDIIWYRMIDSSGILPSSIGASNFITKDEAFEITPVPSGSYTVTVNTFDDGVGIDGIILHGAYKVDGRYYQARSYNIPLEVIEEYGPIRCTGAQGFVSFTTSADRFTWSPSYTLSDKMTKNHTLTYYRKD